VRCESLDRRVEEVEGGWLDTVFTVVMVVMVVMMVVVVVKVRS
jgi:hypothetical protein